MSLLLWILLATLYLVMLWTLGVTTHGRGHNFLFFIGIVFPILWIVGAVVAPTPPVGAAEARSSLQ